MELKKKDNIMMLLAILSALFFVATIASCGALHKEKKEKNNEIFKRMNLEEKVNNYMQEGTSLSAKLKKADKALQEEKAAHETTKKTLAQEQMVNQSLQDEIQKLTKLNQTLEENIKKAVISGKVSTSNK